MTRYAHIVLCFLSLLLFPSVITFPQVEKLEFEHFTTKDGLPDLTVSCILQDQLGYLWFGTDNGLVKYDGYHMTLYQPKPDDPSSLSHHTVKAICEDRDGNLWIGTGSDNDGGLNHFNRDNEKFTRYLCDPNDSTTINSNNINCIYENMAGQIWVGTIKGLNLFESKHFNFKRFYFNYRPPLKNNYNFNPQSEGSVFAITEIQSTKNLLLGTQSY